MKQITTTTTTTTTIETYLSRKQKNLRNPGVVAFVYLFSIVVLIAAAHINPYAHGSPQSMLWLFWPELILSMVFVALSIFVFPVAAIGLGKWHIVDKKLLLPILLILLSAFVSWIYFYFRVSPVDADEWGLLKSLLLVGFTEEWMYRGLLFTALTLAVGVRQGAIASTILFGLAHSMNILGGAPVLETLLQMLLTCLLGAAFVLAVVGSRSIWFGIVIHAMYDFFVVHKSQTLRSVEHGSPIDLLLAFLPIVVVIIVGIYCFIKLFRLKDSDFHPQSK